MKSSDRRAWILATLVASASLLACAAGLASGRTPPAGLATEKATFGGGCFWCMESNFEKLNGVYEAVSGFSGGKEKSPDYKAVSYGKTSHAEVIQVTYDPKVVSYDDLLFLFWRSIDPTDGGGQFVDRGRQYRTAIYYHNEDQKKRAEKSKAALARSERFKKPIVTGIELFTGFYAAEDYHQDFYKKNPVRYHAYRNGSGRDQFIEKVWGKFELPGKKK